MRKIATFIAIGAIGIACGAVPAHAVNANGVTVNLIKNGFAEDAPGSTDGSVVPVPGWTLGTDSQFTAIQYGASGGYPSPTDPGPAKRGVNFLGGGPSAEISTASQNRSLSSYRTQIAAGSVTYNLSGFFGGYSSQEDNASLQLSWLDSSGTQIGAAVTIGAVTASDRGDSTGLLFRKALGTVPADARRFLATVTMTRLAGTNDDGYADNLSLRLTLPTS